VHRPVPSYDAMVCPHPLRRHQREALAAFEAARSGGSTRWWVTMPPGAGKTLVGTEVARLLGRRAVVFSPNTAIQAQWAAAWEAYDGPRASAQRDLRTPFTSLTYQSLAVFEDDAREEGSPTDDGEISHVDRLHPNGRELIETLRAAGPLTIVLDECHHLLEVWGELLREVLDVLPEACVLGLTATPPDSMTSSQAELTAALFGPVLYEARIPALVKERTLAPYAELAWLTEPTADEAAWLREQATRFRELTTDLFRPEFGSTPLPVWLDQRFVSPVADGTTTWAELVAQEPELSDAALRMVHADLLALPEGALLREQHRQPPTAADWRLFLDDWLLHCIQPRSLGDEPGAEGDRAVLEAVRRTLPSIGYVWTKNGIRTGRGTVDRVTARSAAKQGAVAGILAAEHANLGERTRALVLCDHERATATSRRRLTDDDSSPAPDPAGSAVGVLIALIEDPVCAGLNPILVTGRTVAGSEKTLLALVDFLDHSHPGLAASLVVEHDDGLARLSGRWTSGQWAGHVTRFLESGGTRVLVGTRGLLGEGWDAPTLTTLVDLTTATTPTAVVQTRGRALRVDPADPDKVALIWSVVCVHEGHVAGGNDWERYARKHRGHFTVDERGTVTDGVAGVDSTFSAFQPPPATDFGAIDARMLARAEHRDRVRDGWLSESSYADRVEHLLRVRPDRAAAGVPATPGPTGPVPWSVASQQRPGAWVAAVPLVVTLLLVIAVATPLLAAGWLVLAVPLLALAAALWGRSRVVGASRHRVTVGLVASAVADGLRGADLSPVGADGVRVETTPDGVASYRLDGVEEEVSARFATALEEALAPMSGPRYVVRRWVTSAPHGVDGLVRGLRAVTGNRPDGEVWHSVPSVLASTRERADAYAAAWDHWVGGGPAVYAGSPEGAGVIATHRALDPFDVTCVIRRVWH
jgi:superfamily II DNA or RNA helicase